MLRFSWAWSTQEDDFAGDGGGGCRRRGALLWHDREHTGYGADIVPQADTGWAATAFCLRSRAVRLWRAAAADAAWHRCEVVAPALIPRKSLPSRRRGSATR